MSRQHPIDIQVQTEYLAGNSKPEEQQYAFAYHITIANQGTESVKLLNRYWLITDGNGTKKEIAGSGVVGQQPNLKPSEDYSYTSGVILETPVGTMEGHYDMQAASGDHFQASIPVFTLANPKVLN